MDDDLSYLDLGSGDEEYEDLETQETVIDDSNSEMPPPLESTTVEFENENNEIEENSTTEDDILTTFLKSKGIKDPKAIKQLDEQGNIQEVDFNTLSKEEQLNILGSSELDDNYGLENDETQFINLLRDNNLSINDYLDYVRNQAVEQYISANSEPQYTVDNLSDDELYLTDLKVKVKDITEEEAAQFMEHEKANPSLWEKEIESLREIYKQKEAEKIEEDNQIAKAQEQEQLKQYSDSMISTISNLNSIESFDLEDDDKERIAEFVLGTDATGTNYLYKALQDPVNVAKAAWFLMEGEDSIRALNNYWTGVINKHSKSKYDEGYKDALNGNKAKTVVKTTKSSKATKQQPKFISIDENNSFIDLD